ncbi:MAG TPA: class I SAM-dependent methyltransferase [Polyangiaceae bacterium]|nr:class I SAM-dependent methyltransferase [Polyangiaceae bacterium]
MSKPNLEMIEYWQGVAGPKWIRLQEHLDVQLGAIGNKVLETVGLAPNDSVLDVGCGCGSVTLAAARMVAPHGTALGVDISEPMLARARECAAGIDNVSFLCADAQTHAFDRERFDALVSRFGVMFFDDPVAGFRNLRRALRARGTMAFSAWRGIEDNEWASLPLEVARRYVPYEAPPPHTPGPFAFADGARVRAIVEDAGFSEVRVDAFDGELPIGRALQAAGAAALMCELGPAARALRDAPRDVAERVASELTLVLEARFGSAIVALPYGVWLVTARA